MAMAANTDTKLLGVLSLDLSVLRKDVATANNLLKDLGRGINLDMTRVASSQIKKSLQE